MGVESSMSHSNFQFSCLRLRKLDFSENWHITGKGWATLMSSLALVATELEEFVARDCVLSEVNIEHFTNKLF